MIILYEYEKGLYVNLTNRCTCACTFCIRLGHDGVGTADSLWLERDPSKEEVLAAFEQTDLSKYDEVVFCGYGEPTEALDVLIAAAQYVRSVSDVPVRLNTNGLGSLSNGKNVPKLLAGLIDVMSVSMNAPTEEDYLQVTQPCFGKGAFEEMLRFVRECKGVFPKVMVTAVDVITEEQAARCQALADELGVPFRLRKFS